MSRNSKIRAHFFDMDHTLIDADCDVTWKEFMLAEKLAPESAREQAEKFFEDYNLGRLDFEAFTRFQLAEFAGRTEAETAELCRRHFQ